MPKSPLSRIYLECINHFSIMKKLATLLFLLLSTSAIFAQNDFSISSLFSDKMILQSGKEFRVCGTGTIGDKIDIELKTASKTVNKKAKVDRKGEWFANFSALPANIECNFTFSNKSKTLTINGVKTGDIWLIVGGSNTVHLLRNSDFFNLEKAKNDTLQFQYLVIPKASALRPQTIPDQIEWKNHNAENLPIIPTIAYYLGTNLNANLNNPIGIINCGYGGSLIETWMSALDLGFTYESLADKNRLEKQNYTAERTKLFKNRFPYEIKVDEVDDDRSVFSSSSFNDSGWQETLVPETFDKKGLDDFDGVVWFRKDILIPTGVKINKISIGYVDDSDEVYINGQLVGGIKDGYGIARVYEIPENLIKSGKNTIAIRVRDIGGGGGLYGDANLYTISGNGISINIAGNWKYKVEAVETDVEMNDIHRAGMLYNQMINPLTKFPVKGIVWYQGEVEASVASNFSDYLNKLKTLIKGYRREFNDEDLPFIIVQLPSFGKRDSQSLRSWVNFKLIQDQIATEMPNTKIISITDLINEQDKINIHLTNHKPTGERIAKTILAKFYQSDKGSICPRMSKIDLKENSIIMSFDNTQKLIAKDDYNYLKGFEIAGADQKFSKVQARIISNKKVLIKVNNTKPLYLRYCGKTNSIEGNLYNEKEMPVLPFSVELEK